MPITDFPEKGGDKKVSLRNSNFPQFDYRFATRIKNDYPQIWKAGGNIRGNEAFQYWGKARQGNESAGTIDWIREREAWASRHYQDGKAFKDDPDKSPNISNVAGIIAQIKWGVIGNLGESKMKSIILELTKKLEKSISSSMDTEQHLNVVNEEEKEMTEKQDRHVIGISEDENSVTIKLAKDEPQPEDNIRSEEVEEKETTNEEVKTMDEEEKMAHEDEEKQDKASSQPLVFRHFSLKELTQDTIDDESRTVRVAFSSEQPYEREFGIEILDHERANLEFMSSGSAPLLLDHDATKIIGIVENASIDSDKVGRATVRFGKSALAEEVFNDVKDGIRKNISVGYEVFDMKALEKASGEEGSSKRTFKVGFKPLEVSFVSIPADTSVGVGRSASVNNNIRIEGMKEMSEEKTINPNDILKAERKRVDEILALGSEHNCKDLANEHIKSETSVEEFKGVLLTTIAKDKPLSSANSDDLGLSKKEKKEYSLFKMINHQLSKGRSEASFEVECSEEIAKRTGKAPQGLYVPTDIFQRDLTQGTASAGGYVTPDVHRGDLYIDALREQATALRAGATVLRGLKGDIKIPKLTTKGTVGFVAENSAVSETNQAFGQVTMTQRDMGGFVDISRQLLNNANPSIEQIVRNDMTQQIALKLDDVAFEGGGSNEPTGITQTAGIGSVAIGTNGGAITYNATIDLIKEVAVDNGLKGSLGYAVTPEVVYQMRKTPKVASTDSMMIMDMADALNGYPVYQTSQLPKDLTKGTLSSTAHAMIFGNWNDLLVGFYSGLDILVDPFTGSSAGTVRLVFFQGVDVAVRHAQSFSAILDIDETA